MTNCAVPAGATACKQIITASHDICLVNSVAGGAPHVSLAYQGGKKYTLVSVNYGGSSAITAVCYDNIGTGGGG